MEWVETTGRTLEEAKEAALDQLGVDEQDAEFEILEEARFGLFGRLRNEARVRARVRPTKPRPKDERRERRGRRRGPSTDGGAPAGDETARPAASRAAERTGGAGGKEAGGKEASGEEATGEGVSVGGSDREAAGTDRPPRRPRQGRAPADGEGANHGGDDAAPARPTRTRSRPPRDDDRNFDDDMSPGGGMDVSLDEQGVVAREFLDGLVERMNLDAQVATTQPEEDTVELNLEGQDLGLLIGPKGSTLLAIQDLARTVVQRKTSAANGRIMVDVAGYRRKRRDALARFSRQVAEEVQTSGTRRVLEPMSAADRKIVHDTVNQIDGVVTVSEGEDPRRRVVILPAPADS